MNKLDKPKRTSEELIDQLKEKGVKFEIITEADAAVYIKDINNYLRTASYRKNYEKHQLGENKGKYIGLDFAYLVEISKIDMYLRNALLKMCIDIEHALKTRLVAAVEDNPDEDGYNIVDSFLSKNPDVITNIEKKADSIFTGQLIEKYFKLCTVYFRNNSGEAAIATKIYSQDCPVWVLVELLSFGDVIKLISFYNSLYPNSQMIVPDKKVLQPIKNLRNACAHNNCLLYNLKERRTTPNQEITTFVASMKTIGREERNKKLSCRPLFEMVCLLKVYSEFVSFNVKNRYMTDLQSIINDRMFEHIDYFDSNQVIKTSFEFLKKVLDNLT